MAVWTPGSYLIREYARHVQSFTVTDSAEGAAVDVELLDPAYGIAPGQAAVIYDGTRVVGSATISATQRVEA